VIRKRRITYNPKSWKPGHLNGGAKLSPQSVKEIRHNYTDTQTVLAKKYGVSRWTISRVQRGKSYKNVI